MGAYDNELMILADVEAVRDTEVCFIPEPTDGAIAVLSAIRDVASWIKSERPDLYSDHPQLAIEVMRVDDHPKVGRNTNPSLARESQLEREIRTAFPEMDPDIPVVVIANTGLPGVKDHNFTAYREAFTRIVTNHATKVPVYRERHPGYSLAFLVHDESSGYAEAEEATADAPSDEATFPGRAHAWFLDASFTKIIAQSGVDFFLWHTPFKHLWHLDEFGRRAKLELPELAVFDVVAMEIWNGQLVYDASRLISVED